MYVIEVNNTEIGLYHAQAISAGSGHKYITVELEYEGIYETFTAITADMPSYDAATELEGEEKYLALYNIIAHQIKREVDEWIVDVNFSFRVTR